MEEIRRKCQTVNEDFIQWERELELLSHTTLHTCTCTHIDNAKNNIKNTTIDYRDMENNNNRNIKNTQLKHFITNVFFLLYYLEKR